jgi:prepilin-type processing-associated H-X9-DG protein
MLLQPYVKACEVLRCPSFPANPSAAGPPDPRGDGGRGYGLNAVLLGDDCQPRTVASLRHSPSQVALIGDSAVPRSAIWVERATAGPWPRGWVGTVSLQDLDQWPSALPPPATIYWGWQTSQVLAPGWGPDLHGGGANFAFADGHARFLRPSEKVIRLIPPPLPGEGLSASAAPEKAGSFPDALLE